MTPPIMEILQPFSSVYYMYVSISRNWLWSCLLPQSTPAYIVLWFGLSNSSLIMPNLKKLTPNYLVRGCTQDKCTLHHPKLTCQDLQRNKKYKMSKTLFFLLNLIIQIYNTDNLKHRLVYYDILESLGFFFVSRMNNNYKPLLVIIQMFLTFPGRSTKELLTFNKIYFE